MNLNMYKVKMMTLTAMVAAVTFLLPVQGNVQAQSTGAPLPTASSQQSQQVQPSSQLQSNTPAIDPRSAVKQAVDRIANHPSVPGMLAVVTKNGEKWSYSAGEASIYDTRTIKADSHFRIGSVTKTFVATVVLQLVEENKLSLDDSVEKWLPGVIQGNGYDGSKITIRQLLNHTSGIANYTSEKFIKDLVHTPYRGYTEEELVGIALSNQPLFAPGTSWEYSNTNTVIVGLIIKKVTGETYGEQIKKRIIDPLQLKGTSVPGTSSYIPDQHARGYVKLDGKFIDMTEINPSWGNAAGDMISTGEDLNTFFSALLGGKLLKPEQLKQMLTGVETPIGKYGLSIYETKLPNGVTLWGHSGGIHGSGTYVAGTLDGKHVMTLNMNIMDFDAEGPSVADLIDVYAKEFQETVVPLQAAQK